jgi:hypothetical protein
VRAAAGGALIQAPKRIQRKVVPWPESRLRRVELALPERFKPCIPLGAGLGLRQDEMFVFSLDNVDPARDGLPLHAAEGDGWQ